ncbi:MAG: hypothetical protein ABIO04_04485 [Ferruginibacter sp.]
MPQSKKRKSQQHPHPDFIPHEKKRQSAIPAAIIFCMLIGAGIAAFAVGFSMPELLLGAAIGGVVGFIAGKQMDKTFKIDKKQ